MSTPSIDTNVAPPGVQLLDKPHCPFARSKPVRGKRIWMVVGTQPVQRLGPAFVIGPRQQLIALMRGILVSGQRLARIVHGDLFAKLVIGEELQKQRRLGVVADCAHVDVRVEADFIDRGNIAPERVVPQPRYNSASVR